MLPYATSVHLKGSIAGEDGKREKADWKRLVTMIGKSGYKGYVGLEYEDNAATMDVPGLAANLRTLIRMVSA
jgi:hydroxypyruvate isomerase